MKVAAEELEVCGDLHNERRVELRGGVSPPATGTANRGMSRDEFVELLRTFRSPDGERLGRHWPDSTRAAGSVELRNRERSAPQIAVVTQLTLTTLRYMSSQSIRIESETLRALRERSAESGEPLVRLAQRYIDEGMRLDRHPGIVFRDGPAGRRAVVVGGPDVWEVIAAARTATERGEELIEALGERVGLPSESIRLAIRYYAEYPDEVDRFIAMVEEEAERLEQTLERERRLLG